MFTEEKFHPPPDQEGSAGERQEIDSHPADAKLKKMFSEEDLVLPRSVFDKKLKTVGRFLTEDERQRLSKLRRRRKSRLYANHQRGKTKGRLKDAETTIARMEVYIRDLEQKLAEALTREQGYKERIELLRKNRRVVNT